MNNLILSRSDILEIFKSQTIEEVDLNSFGLNGASKHTQDNIFFLEDNKIKVLKSRYLISYGIYEKKIIPKEQKICKIINDQFSWRLEVDENVINFDGHSNAEYFRDLYSNLGYKIEFDVDFYKRNQEKL